MNTGSDIYKMTAAINKARKAAQAWDHPLEEKYVLDNVYAFSRGEMLVATTNRQDQVSFSPTAASGWNEGQTVCNVFYPTTDCLNVSGGKINITLVNGESKIFLPQSSSFFGSNSADDVDFL